MNEGERAESNEPEPEAAAGGHAAETPSEARSGLAGVASTIADAAAPVISAALRPVGELTSGARRRIGERSGARVRHVRQRGRRPLPNLWQVHPEAHRAALRELGLRTVPVEQIVGTAVEGPTQRGGDFLPLRQLRGLDWRARWQRILNAIDQLVTLPPIDLLKLGDEYWVVDGHNRVAAALYTGQIALDANVVELRLPGVASAGAAGNLAPFLEGSRDVRQAGSGRFTRTSVRPASGLPEHALHEHTDERGGEHTDERADQPSDRAAKPRHGGDGGEE